MAISKVSVCEKCKEEKEVWLCDVEPQNFVVTKEEKIVGPTGREGRLMEGYSTGPSKARMWLCEDCQ